MEVSKALIVLAFVLAISLSEAAGQSLAFLANRENKSAYLFVAWLVYGVVVWLLHQVYKHRGVGYVNALWSGMTLVLMLMIGHMFYKEKLTFMEWLGIFIIVVGMVVMAFSA